MDNGGYNDQVWTLQTVTDEPDRESSVRFLVWLDYKLSGSDRDFMKDFSLSVQKANMVHLNGKKHGRNSFRELLLKASRLMKSGKNMPSLILLVFLQMLNREKHLNFLLSMM